MTIWLTADHHAGHHNIIEYTNRPFANVAEMDSELIRRHNKVVAQNESVYMLGDVTLANLEYTYNFLNQLNGTLYIVPGGHDYWIEKHNRLPSSVELASKLQPNKVVILPSLYTLKPVYTRYPSCILCHFALRTWHKSHYNSFHFHGHSHGQLPTAYNCLDVGVDVHNFYPISLDKASKKIEKNNENLDKN